MPRRRPRWPWLVAGAAAALAGVGAGSLASAVLGQRTGPVGDVAETVIDLTPGDTAEGLISLVGHWDKPLLLLGVVLAVLLLGALAGLVAARTLLGGVLMLCGLAAVAGIAATTRPSTTMFAIVPVVLAGLVAVVTLTLLTSRLRDLAVDDTGPGSPWAAASRRTVVAGLAVAAVGGLAALLGRRVGRGRREVEALRDDLDLPLTRPTLPAGVDPDVAGLTPWQTGNDDFYLIHTAISLPVINPREWRLRIHGLVEREIELTYDDLLARRFTEEWMTLNCVSNPVGGDLIGNAWWSGVRIADILAEAGVRPEADAIKQTSDDGWTCGTPIEALTDDRGALLALGMNGEPLPIEHGFPVRMIVPGLYGYVSATKWLVDLEVTRFDDFEAFWTQRGWGEKGPVKLGSRIDVPSGDVSAGEVVVAGVAWQQHTGIEGVQVSMDGGPWTDVEVVGDPGIDSWVQWRGTVTADPGDHEVRVRAVSRADETQTGVRRDVLPDGATGWDAVSFSAG